MRSGSRPPGFISRVLLILSIICCCFAVAAWSKSPAAGSSDRSAPPPADAAPSAELEITIPGPLSSFLRMAAISQKVPPARVLPLLARNVAMEGYGWYGKKARPTEYLNLLRGYLKHARALAALAGPGGAIRVTSCDGAAPLLKVLGYRLRNTCGPQSYLQTSDPKQAFLTIDSGFPLTELERSLRDGKPFVYSYSTSQVPVLFDSAAWMACDRSLRKVKLSDTPSDQQLADFLVTDPRVARLYWAMARMDANTRRLLEQSPGLQKLVAFAPVLDFYGSEIYVSSGRVMVPGGAAAEPAWKSLVGASPEHPAAFIMHLLGKDEGWLAAYYDALARAPQDAQTYFTAAGRLRMFYRALRGKSDSPQPARPVFRPNPGLVLLVNRLQIEPSGEPHIPGGLRAWKDIFGIQRRSRSKLVRDWAGHAKGWKNPDQLIASMFALSRVNSETGPLQLFLSMIDIDHSRTPAEQLSARTVRLLAANFRDFGDQYPIFSEFHALNDNSIARYIAVAQGLDRIHEHAAQSDAVGIFQANVGLWEILARQGEIAEKDWNDSWQRVIAPFARVSNAHQTFNAAERSLDALMRAASGSPQVSQAALINVLAGPDNVGGDSGQRVHQDLAYRIQSAMEAQGLIPLETLFALGNGLDHASPGRRLSGSVVQEAGALREFKMPKPLFSSGERAEWSYGLFSNPHLQVETAEEKDLAKIVKSPPSGKEIQVVRSQLTPFLRDTLVGLNYAYYQPPGDQMLYNNPLFVRSHDFSGQSITGRNQAWKTPMIFGRGWTASGGAHLVGSLANLPYVLARVEQNFIVPDNVQALIWEDLVPTFLTNSVVPRWWRVTPDELHAVALYQRLGADLVTASAKGAQLRQQVVGILSGRMLPSQFGEVEAALRAGYPQQAVSLLAPADLFFLAGQFRAKFPAEVPKQGKEGQELDALCRRDPGNTSWQRLSEDFGDPHPALAGTYGLALLNSKPFPTYLGYSSRLLAESWQSNNLYWARLADHLGYSPVMLNLLAPDLTRQMIANIFATDLQDRPALLSALRETGEEFVKSRTAASARREVAAGARDGLGARPNSRF